VDSESGEEGDWGWCERVAVVASSLPWNCSVSSRRAASSKQQQQRRRQAKGKMQSAMQQCAAAMYQRYSALPLLLIAALGPRAARPAVQAGVRLFQSFHLVFHCLWIAPLIRHSAFDPKPPMQLGAHYARPLKRCSTRSNCSRQGLQSL
jgi:hypothetical protein